MSSVRVDSRRQRSTLGDAERAFSRRVFEDPGLLQGHRAFFHHFVENRDQTRFRELLEGMIRDWDVRLAHREGEAPLRLLETLALDPESRRSPLSALAFDRRGKRKEQK